MLLTGVDTVKRRGWGRTWVDPLHAVGECCVGDEVVSSPAGIGNDAVC